MPTPPRTLHPSLYYSTLCSGRRILLLALGSFGCCCLLSFFGLAPVGERGLLLSRGGLSVNFLDRAGYGFCLGLGCRELRAFPSLLSPKLGANFLFMWGFG